MGEPTNLVVDSPYKFMTETALNGDWLRQHLEETQKRRCFYRAQVLQQDNWDSEALVPENLEPAGEEDQARW